MGAVILGLRKEDVDLQNQTILVGRSYGRNTTEGKHADLIPIAAPLLPYLRAAISRRKGPLVFPNSGGKMQSETTDLAPVLQRALARAGFVEGYDHTCRRCKARGVPHVERDPDHQLRTCPVCSMKLWPVAIPRPLRFHDLRHTTATLLLRAGVDMRTVQRILRHKDVTLTTGTYGHLDVEDNRRGISKLPALPPPDTFRKPAANDDRADELDSGATQALPEDRDGGPGSESGVANLREYQGKLAGRTGLEPVAFGFEGHPAALPTASHGVTCSPKPLDFTGVQEGPDSSQSHTATADSTPFGTRLVPGTKVTARRLQLVSVRQAAGTLGLSTATVYGLVSRNELAAIRIGGAVRIAVTDLKKYVEDRRCRQPLFR